MQKPLLHQRYQERTGLSGYLDIRAHFHHYLCIDAASYRSLRADDPDLSVFRRLGRRPGACVDYTDDGNIQFSLHRLQRIGRRSVARDNNRLYILCQEKADNLSRKTDHRIAGLIAVRNSGRITEIDDPLFRHLPHNLPRDSQTTDTGIKYPYG